MSKHANILACDVSRLGAVSVHSQTIAGSSDVWLDIGPMRTSIDPAAARRLAAYLIDAAEEAERSESQQASDYAARLIDQARRSA